MQTLAVVLDQPKALDLRVVELVAPGDDDVVVDVHFSGISTGTERLLWTGRMPSFPGMGYPLVPGYEATGEIVRAGRSSGRSAGEQVFVPGANCYGAVKGLFGGAAQRLVTKGSRVLPVDRTLGPDAVLMALAATAHHAIVGAALGAGLPDLIIGHGILGRLLARLTLALGGAPPTVFETSAARRTGDFGYPVIDPVSDTRRDYRAIYDASGDASGLDGLIGRVARGGEIVLAGFYDQRLSFDFVPAFLREVRLRVAAEWAVADLEAAGRLVTTGELSLAGLVTHSAAPQHADDAYRTAFEDPTCLKMTLDWRGLS